MELQIHDSVKINGKVYRWGGDCWFASSGLSVWHPGTLANIEVAIAKGKLVREVQPCKINFGTPIQVAPITDRAHHNDAPKPVAHVGGSAPVTKIPNNLAREATFARTRNGGRPQEYPAYAELLKGTNNA